MSILEEIAAKTRERVEAQKLLKSPAEIIAKAETLPRAEGLAFERALSMPGVSLICEVKKASPSKGMICPEFPYLSIAKDYEAGGAAAISVLTEPHYFLGDDRYLTEISRAGTLPLLRKDFTVDSYQIYEAKLIGASAVLLIAALLDEKTLREYLRIAQGLGLGALVEAHTAEEVKTALGAGARIVGVNNRDLRTFEVDLSTSEKLRPLVPKGVRFVSESGINARGDIARLEEIGADAALIGESLMRSGNIREQLRALKGETL
ncbi:MAG: indole-3-glycerol phosphate synthase TrpC [Bacillota bacterium]